MHIFDLRKRFNYLVDQRAVVTDPDEQSRLEIQIGNYRHKIERSELAHHLMSLEFEVRYETDHVERDYIANDRDAVKRELAALDGD